MNSNPAARSPLESGAQSNAEKQLIARLKSCQKITSDFIEDRFQTFYKSLDDRITETIREAASNAEQRYFYDVQRHLRHNVDELLRHLVGYIGEGFVKFKKGDLDTHSVTNTSNSLSLVENDELEEDIAVSSSARRADTKYVEVLWALNKRFSALIGGAPVTDANNPAAPIQFCDSMRRALSILNLELKPKLIAYEEFENHYTSELEPLLMRINDYLVGEGILPELSFHQQSATQAHESSPGFHSEFESGNPAAASEAAASVAPPDPEVSIQNQANLMRAIREIQNHGSNISVDPGVSSVANENTAVP